MESHPRAWTRFYLLGLVWVSESSFSALVSAVVIVAAQDSLVLANSRMDCSISGKGKRSEPEPYLRYLI